MAEPVATPAPAAPAAPAPAPQAPAAPSPAPTAPEVTPAPVATPTPAQLSPEEAAAKAEDDGWSEAAKQQYPELADKKEPGKDGQPKPKKDGEAAKEGEESPGNEKVDEGAGDGNDAKTESEADTPKDAATVERDSRIAARQRVEQTKAVVADVREKMFPGLPTELRDADGDPIKSIEDVMGLINNRTGEPFTEEEAGMWLLSAQQQFNQNLAKTEKQIEDIAELQLTIKDEADYVTQKYGDLLKDEALREDLWARFEKTLVRDEKSGVITKMPLSLEEFYELALEPRMAAQAAAATPAAPVVPGTPADPAAAAQAATDTKAAAERARQQNRADRSDIYAVPPTDPNVDPEDKEWGQAHKDYYGDRIK
jgi:hypothetical protein